MKKSLHFLLLLLLFFNTGLWAQKLSVTDSVILYLRQVRGLQRSDSVLLENAVKAINRTSSDTLPVGRIESELIKLLPVIHRQNCLAVKTALSNVLSMSKNISLAINYNKKLIAELTAYSGEFEKNLLLTLLEQARMPYKNSLRIYEGLGYYQRLVNDFEQVNDSDAISVCYRILAVLNRTLGITDRSIYFWKKSSVFLDRHNVIKGKSFLIEKYNSIGLTGYINRKAVIGFMFIENEEPQKAFPYLYEAKNIFESVRDSIEVVEAPYIILQIIRAKIMTGGDSVYYYFGLMKKMLDTINSPDYFTIYCQTLGYYCYLQNRMDSAEYYIQKSENLKESNKFSVNSNLGSLIPGYYLSLIKINQHKYPEAIRLLRDEGDELIKANLRRVALKELQLLSKAYKLNGDPKNSNATLEQYITLHQKIIDDENRSRSASFETEQQINLLNTEKQKQQQEVHRQKLIRNWISGLLALVFAFSAVFLIQHKRILKEKKRSEELLLNILPFETAKELKEKGKSDAKLFDEVTVMFTDFKGFTRISEKLSPGELVAEIDTCFSAFDDIITRHNIEKIKTIGDSYMCAGGLPVPNKTNAADIVNAALEIRDFMLKRKSGMNNPGFEIRIGVHTGTVVAGIVGIIKFAYDIWGDTVNIASRMESSGEPGKVNISGATYELVKSRFTCTYRGKVQAKSKGEIDMYFIENNS
ncbi:MAG: adenylate/guanylate cyclase domain-containing protein [Bacteroidetes bacterium]|nr:adenylate/guanylate cyclase domain-containing protein [Bacteroidota bacterium]